MCAPSPTGSKFSKILLEQLYTRWIAVVHLYCSFSLWRQMASQQSAKSITAFFGQFRTSLRKDSVANYASIGTLFTPYVKGLGALCKALNIPYFRLYVAPQQWWKSMVEIVAMWLYAGRSMHITYFGVFRYLKDSPSYNRWLYETIRRTIRV